MRAAKLKSLVWREWRVERKNFYAIMLVIVVLCVFFWLFRLSMSVGNLAPIFGGDDGILAEFGGMIYYLSTTLVGVLAVGTGYASHNVWISDINANWLPYSYTLPISAKERTITRYIIKLGEMAAGFCLAVINGIVTAKITGTPFTGHMVLLFLACAALVICYDALLQFFVLRARTASGVQAGTFKTTMVVMFLTMFIVVYKGQTDPGYFDNAYMDDIVSKMTNEFISHESIIILFVIFSFAVMLPLGFYISYKAVEHYGDVKHEKAEVKQKFSLPFGSKKPTGGEEDAA